MRLKIAVSVVRFRPRAPLAPPRLFQPRPVGGNAPLKPLPRKEFAGPNGVQVVSAMPSWRQPS
ncbi:hypothetical protein CHELA40_13683 [Chelatococcus asaccharovorans]|nr:hypothetical protein CHELA40_13683 [Chelatococcus asaccharovorans]CAH1676351.1 hypothetical protein CHELA17_61942 [Chelatococcus asaccharovorans]